MDWVGGYDVVIVLIFCADIVVVVWIRGVSG